MAAKRTIPRNKIVERVGAALAKSEPHMLQRTPYLPDLLNQPSFLMVPQLGRLIAIYVLTPSKAVTWIQVLASIEDLFEIKSSCGEATITIAVLVPGTSQTVLGSQALEVLSRYFDGFTVIEDIEVGNLQKVLLDLVRESTAREELYELWRSEHHQTANNLRDFSEKRYSPFVETLNRRNPSKRELLNAAASSLEGELDLRVFHSFSVRSPKEAFVGLPERNRISFDLGAEYQPDGVTVPIEVTSLDRYGSREKLRYLMTKARLAKYRSDGRKLVLEDKRQRPILVVSGNIAGPTHDPYRYIRALVSVGWRLVSASDPLLKEVYANV